MIQVIAYRDLSVIAIEHDFFPETKNYNSTKYASDYY